MDWTLALVRERLYWGTMKHDVTGYVTNCHQCHVTKGHYTGVQTQHGSFVANNPLHQVQSGLCCQQSENTYCHQDLS